MNILSLVPRQKRGSCALHAWLLDKRNTLLNLVVINSNYQDKYTLWYKERNHLASVASLLQGSTSTMLLSTGAMYRIMYRKREESISNPNSILTEKK
jgi:hypothetical protein